MSTVRTNRIELGDGSAGVDSDFVVNGSAKAYGSFSQNLTAYPADYGSNAMGDTFNVSSFIDVGVGHMRLTFTNHMSNGKYAPQVTTHLSGENAVSGYGAAQSEMSSVFDKTTSQMDLGNSYANGNARDAFFSGILVHGDLA